MSVVRGFVVIVYAIAFFVALWSSSTVWPLIELGGANVEAIVIFTLLVAFCGVLISIFVYIDGEQIDRLREFTGLAQHEKEEITSEILPKRYAKVKKQPLCGSCAFFGKPVLCPLGEKNPKAIACVHYRRKR